MVYEICMNYLHYKNVEYYYLAGWQEISLNVTCNNGSSQIATTQLSEKSLATLSLHKLLLLEFYLELLLVAKMSLRQIFLQCISK